MTFYDDSPVPNPEIEAAADALRILWNSERNQQSLKETGHGAAWTLQAQVALECRTEGSRRHCDRGAARTMSDVGSMVAELIAAGCAPEVAAQVVASAFIAGVNSANFRGIPVDAVAEKRRAYDRERKRKSTGIPPESTGIPILPLSKNIDKKERGRGTRLPPEWTPDETDRAFAKQLGWSDAQIDSEAANFRDYWIAKPGAGGCKLDWPATWRKWVRSSKVKPAGGALVGGPSDPKLSPDDAVVQFKRLGIWSKASPFKDISKVPPDLLSKHGLLSDGRKIA